MIFFFILITCLVDIVLILLGEILSWSLMGVKGLSTLFFLHLMNVFWEEIEWRLCYSMSSWLWAKYTHDLYFHALAIMLHFRKISWYRDEYPFFLIWCLLFRYKNYEFVSDQEISKSAGLGSRYSDSSLHGVLFDIQMLSECDFLVCTFSSQVKYASYWLFFAFCLKAKGTSLRQEHSPVKGKWYIS